MTKAELHKHIQAVQSGQRQHPRVSISVPDRKYITERTIPKPDVSFTFKIGG